MQDRIQNYPLAVDLDRTFIRSDLLHEMFASCFVRSPVKALIALLTLRKGIAAFKRALFDAHSIDFADLPVREDFAVFLQEQLTNGREICLVTAADQRVADAVRASYGLFNRAFGSNGSINLKGAAKLALLQHQFPDGFAYAGDSAADLQVWTGSRAAIPVGISDDVRKKLAEQNSSIEREFFQKPVRAIDWLRCLRLHQWTKNFLIFLPLMLSHSFDQASFALAMLAFVLMGMLASGTYIINDLADISADRAHATKRFRPIASGTISALHALIASLVLITSAICLTTFISPLLTLTFVLYLVSTLAYALKLKTIAFLDVFVLGWLYTLRLLAGAAAVAVSPSQWLLMFAFFFFLSLSLVKRNAEIVKAAEKWASCSDRSTARRESRLIKGRGYRISDEPLTLAFGVGTGLAATLILSMYVALDMQPMGAYHHPELLFWIVLAILLWLMRVWLLSHRGEMHDDPIIFAIRDPASLILGLVVAAIFASATL
ncbi:UbiA family prenyltransferase [Rhodopseudomonas telluris]|uniref:UbiA family prenyltransferase n=1 Tax=Rhodopseudomonas telluris TaxID=644215 RepID=A0ABV6EZN3_9BRAD